MRTALTPDTPQRAAPVYLERLESLPVDRIEISDTVRDFHRASLARGVYRHHGGAGELVWPEGARGVSYFQMAGLALEVLADDRDFDLVVFVTATPDCQLTHFAGPRFNEEIPGRPGIMGIGDHGVAGPFTALRLVVNHLRHGLADRALVLVMEQSMLPVLPGQLRVPGDSAVAMIVSMRDGLRIDRVAVERAEHPAPRAADTVGGLLVQGAGGDFIDPRGFSDVWKTEATYACTGVWERFSTGFGADPGHRVVLADADATLPYRCLAELSGPVEEVLR